MSYKTNFDKSPYWDDFDENKDFHKILFQPSVAVQARELNQLQSILQNQIAKFGDNVLREGTIISGCNFVELASRFNYVKIMDQSTDGITVVIGDYLDAKAVGVVTGVEAKIVDIAGGYQSQAPDLNTLYLKYTKSGTSNEKVFSPSENIEIQNWTNGNVIKTVTVAGSVDLSPVGNSYGVRVDGGWIFQKGTFVRVDPQLTIVSKYTNTPNDVLVGFSTNESIITSNNDSSLYDNAIGSPNFNAPGADRFKLVAILVAKTKAEAKADEAFFAIQEYTNGKVSRRNLGTKFNSIDSTLSRRTFEESGNYTVHPFGINVQKNDANTSLLTVDAGPGLAYVDGSRVELINTIKLDIDKSFTANTEIQQNIITNYGHYVVVDEMIGSFAFNNASSISLINAPQTRFTAGTVGTIPSGQIGTAKIHSIVHHAGTVGTATGQSRLYLFDIKMNSGSSFKDVKSFFFNGTTNKGAADAVIAANSSVAIDEFAFQKMIFPIGRESIKNIPSASTKYVYRNVDTSLSMSLTGTIVINLTAGQQWPYNNGLLNLTQKEEITLIANSTQAPYIKGIAIDLSNVTVNVVSPSSIAISGLTVPAATTNIIAYYNVEKIAAGAAGKKLVTTYVKIAANSSPNGVTGNYCLGVPDVFSIEGVYQSSNGLYSESASNVTNSFQLIRNQKDTFYDLSRARKNRTLVVGANDTFLFKVKAFEKNVSGSYGEGFFTVNSYPIDDVNVANTSSITTQEIPEYITSSGEQFLLRDVVDFRLFATNTAGYANTISAATVNPSSTVSFGSTDLYIPAPNQIFEANYDYYLGREDLLTVSKNGIFSIIKGEPSDKPTKPAAPAIGMVLASLSIPPFPSLPKREADIANKPEYGVSFSTTDVRRYTMKDIGQLDKRISTMEYYSALNMLEQKSFNHPILDSAGLNRFKNGIFVDNFENFNSSNVASKEFSVSIVQNYNEMAPKFRMYPLKLKAASNPSWTNTVDKDNMVVTLPSTEKSMIDQPYATSFRSCTTDFYNWNGMARIEPAFDTNYDVTQAPDINFQKAFTSFTNALSEFIPLTRESRSVARVGNSTVTTTTTLSLTNSGSSVNDIPVGNFVTDVRFNPFMAPNRIRVKVSGLRPSTIFHFYFDGKSVDGFVAPAEQKVGSSKINDLIKSGVFGSTVSSDANGELKAVFDIPSKTFYVGERVLTIMDVNNFLSKSAASSSANVTYRAYNLGVTKTSTRMPSYSVTSGSSSSTVYDPIHVPAQTVQRSNPHDGPANDGNGNGGPDPISQTFFVVNAFSDDKVVLTPKVDVFFSSKSAIRGVEIQIREVLNGYPTNTILPFATKHLNSNEVNVSNNGSIATTVIFDVPVVLETAKEYALIIAPDGSDPDYRIWISKTGEIDLVSGLNITQDFNSGVLFTSTNGTTWTPQQTENMKFTIYQNEFTATSGDAYFTNKDTEFLNISTMSGSFIMGERVVANTVNLAGTVAFSSGNNIVVGSGTNFNQSFSIGDIVSIRDTSNSIIALEISNISSNTNMTVLDIPLSSNTIANYFSAPSGIVSYINSSDPARIHLDFSTAKSGKIFAANNVLIGSESNAEATIVNVVNQNISYMQPNVVHKDFINNKTTLTATSLFSGTTTYSTSLQMNANKYLTKNPTIIKSRTNEIIDNNGTKSFVLGTRLENNSVATNKYSSPIVDYDISVVNVYEYLINNSSLDENTSEGAAESKYVSKTIELASGLDADDIKVYIDAYRPPQTDIKVYARLKSASDTSSIDEIEWTELLRKGETNFTSSNANRFDYKEFEYYLGSTVLGNGAGAYLFNNIAQYKNSSGVIFNTYKQFAIKIVLLSSSYDRVPRLLNQRTIALSA